MKINNETRKSNYVLFLYFCICFVLFCFWEIGKKIWICWPEKRFSQKWIGQILIITKNIFYIWKLSHNWNIMRRRALWNELNCLGFFDVIESVSLLQHKFKDHQRLSKNCVCVIVFNKVIKNSCNFCSIVGIAF